MNNLIISKDKYLNTYIVFELHRNYMVERYRGYKYQCQEYIKKVCSKHV